jgi:hypothetical protein
MLAIALQGMSKRWTPIGFVLRPIAPRHRLDHQHDSFLLRSPMFSFSFSRSIHTVVSHYARGGHKLIRGQLLFPVLGARG